MMKKYIIKKIICILCIMGIFWSTSCGSDTANSYENDGNSKKEQEKQPELPEKSKPSYPAVEPPPAQELQNECVIRLRTDQSGEYRDVVLKPGECIDKVERLGFTFKGYQDAKNTIYIDEDGKLIKEYHGKEEALVLWPVFVANDYEIIICENNQPLDNFNKIISKYDADIKRDLPFGRELKAKNKYENDKVITGFSNRENADISFDGKKVSLQKIAEKFDCIDHENQEMILNIQTTDVSYLTQRLDTYSITNDGYLKQKLGSKSKTYDVFDMSKKVNLEELNNLGYKNAEVELTVVLDKGKGNPCIKVMNHKISNKKEFKEEALIEIEGIEKKKVRKDETYVVKEIVPIDKINEKIYVYYNSDTMFNSKWKTDACTIQIRFTK